MHGLWMAASNMLKAIQASQETKFPIEVVCLGVDALSQVVGLMKQPQSIRQN